MALATAEPAAEDDDKVEASAPAEEEPTEDASAPSTDPLRQALIEDAKKFFKEGSDFFTDRRYKEAAEAFHESYIAVPSGRALLNEARSWRGAGDRPEALRLFERYQALGDCEGAEILCAANRDFATKQVQELRQQVAELEIVVMPGAEIRGIEIDGEELPVTVFPIYTEPGELELFVIGTEEGQRRRETAQMKAGQRYPLQITPFPKDEQRDEVEDRDPIRDPGNGRDPEKRRQNLRIAFYASLGATVASGVALGVIGGFMLEAYREYDGRCTTDCMPGVDMYPQAARDRFERLEPAWTGMLIVTSGLALTSVTLAIFAFSKRQRGGQRASTKKRPTAQMTGNGLRVRW